jgi:RNA polymerase sigma-70 factor (ECF subfamily)
MDHTAATIMPGAATEQDVDQLLVARYLDGDLVAFDELMTRHERQIYRLCYRFVRNHDDAMDLTQDVFVKAFEKLPSFRGDARFKTWLYRVAVNHCLNHVKKHSQNFVEVTEETGRVKAAADDRLLAQERRRIVRDLMPQLPPRQRAIFEMRMNDNLSYEEIAKILNRSVSTIKSSVFFALTKLKKLVNPQTLKGPSV